MLTNAEENLKRHYSAPLKKDKKFLKYSEKQLTKPTVSNIIILNT